MEKEERRSERKLVLKNTEYVLVPSSIVKTFEAVITDISEFGLCLLTTSHLKDGQNIIISNNAQFYEKPAIVQWSQEYEDMFYKIGLEFKENQSIINSKDKRRHKRFIIKNYSIHGGMVLANYIKILDISLEGLSIEIDRRLSIGKEYVLHLEHEGKKWPIKGNIIWSILRNSKGDNKSNIVPTYVSGMKLTSAPSEMYDVINFIELQQKKGEPEEYFYFSLEEIGIRGKEKEYLESYLNSLFTSVARYKNFDKAHG
jgi:hypothetical protein